MRSSVLVTIGDLVQDVVVWPAGPIERGTDNPAAVHRTRGGSAANVAVFASRFGPSRFIGRVGDDALGRALVAELERAGVEPRVQVAGRTGSIVILVDEAGERTMFPDRAAAAELADVPVAWLDGAALVHATAYAFATPESHATTAALLRAARQRSMLVSLDAASVGVLRTQQFAETLRTIEPDFLFANRDEAQLLRLDCLALPRTTVVVKDGPRPIVVRTPAGTTSVDIAPISARDTTGAGDAFAAGYLSAVLDGAHPSRAVRVGHELATTVLGTPGAASDRS
jgi:sugar/nucleoside kinase (ribokinase family)